MMLNNICRFFLLDLYFLKLNAASTSSYLTAAFQKLSILPEPFIDCRKNQAQPDPAPLEMSPVKREMKEDRLGVLLTVLDLMLGFKMQPTLTFFFYYYYKFSPTTSDAGEKFPWDLFSSQAAILGMFFQNR